MESKRYKRLLKAQKLMKQHDEAIFAQTQKEKYLLEEERQYFFKNWEKNGDETLLDHSWVKERLRKNAKKDAIIEEQLNMQRQNLQESNYRSDLLEDKKKQAFIKEDRKALAIMLSEYLMIKKS